jgi:hypothetical protein
MNEKHQANLNIKVKEASTASAGAKGNPKKCSALGNPGEQVPKRKQGMQSSASIARTRVAPIWLTTPTNVASTTRTVILWQRPQVSPSKQRSPLNKKGGNKQLAYLTVTIKSLVKKGLKKAAKSMKCKPCYDSSNSDSDSE